jgi:hypothetical protein
MVDTETQTAMQAAIATAREGMNCASSASGPGRCHCRHSFFASTWPVRYRSATTGIQVGSDRRNDT